MTDPNSPINPTIESINHGTSIEIRSDYHGLSIREHFACLAMQALLSNSHDRTAMNPFKIIIENAVKCADLLIEELNKTN